MIASYFVSMCVTPVACRYFLGHAEHGRLRQAPSRRVIDRLAERLRARARAACCRSAGRSSAASRVLVLASGWAAARLPSTFFPEIDESMEHDLRPLRAGHLARGRRRADQRDGRDARRASCRQGTVELVLANVGSPQNARSAIDQPERRARTWASSGWRFSDPEQRTLSQARDRRRSARDILDARVPRRRDPAVRPAASSPACSPTATSRRSSSRCAATTSRSSTRRRKAVAEVARTVPGVRDVRPSLQIDYPEIRVDTDREKAGLVGVTLARRRADDARGDARQHQHAERLDRLRTTASRTTSSPPTTAQRVADTEGARRSSRCASATTGQPVTLGAYGDDPALASGPIAIERNQLAARGARAHADRGARHRQRRRASSSARSRSDPRTARRQVRLRRPGRADAHHLLGPRPGARPGGDGGVHDHGLAVQVAAAAVRHAVHHPGVAGRHRPGADGGGAGLLDHRADGRS